jgi:hypothetical protein
MNPGQSIYDLFKVVFSDSAIMLKRALPLSAPIIEYSKREFYEHELKPLRLPKASERLDPPLIDVFVEDGFRKGISILLKRVISSTKSKPSYRIHKWPSEQSVWFLA